MLLIAIRDIHWWGIFANRSLVCKSESLHFRRHSYTSKIISIAMFMYDRLCLTCLFHLSISWNRFNKYKTLLHTPSFAASYRYIKIVVTSAICYHTSVFYSIVLKWLCQLDSHYLYLQNTTRIKFEISSISGQVQLSDEFE